MSSATERLKQFRTDAGLRGVDAAEAIGVTKAVWSDWETGKAPIRKPNCLAIQAIYGVSAAWLLDGEGPMWLGAPTGAQGASDLFLDRPLILGAASCGPGGEIQDPGPQASRYALRRDFASRILKRCGGGHEADLFFLLCRGESMQPTILDKEIVLLNAAMSVRMAPANNGIYLVRRDPQDQEARVKRLRLDEAAHELVLSSDNRAYSSVRLPLDGTPIHHLVLGRVCWVGRYLLETDPPADDW